LTLVVSRTQDRVKELKQQVFSASAVELEKQALHAEKLQQWDKAANSWLRVAEGRPQDSLPWQRAALAQLQAGVELRAAVESAKRAVQLAPNDADAHRTLAKVYSAADMQASAARALEAARRCGASSDSADDTTPTGLLKRFLGRERE
jgi:tetratricopeptide (TPR) repeat protein